MSSEPEDDLANNFLPALVCPGLSAANVSYLTEPEDDLYISCFLRPFLTWILLFSLLIIGLLSLLYKLV